MTPALHSLTFFALAGFTFVLLGSVASAMIAGAARGRIARLPPLARHSALLLLALLPMLAATALLLSASLPSLISLVRPDWDHCLTHDDGHPHLCFLHLPHQAVHVPLLLSLVFVVTYALVRALLSLVVTLRAVRRVRALASTGVEHRELGITLLESAQSLCLTAGFLRPRILISRGLLEALDVTERTIVLAHEREHVRRKDALLASLVRVCGVLHLPNVARWLVRETQIAAEQVCDEWAAARVGDRLAVAAVLLKVERAAGANDFGAVAVGVNACAIERRVEALLGEPRPESSLGSVYGALAGGAVLTLAAANHVHHATESLLSFFLH